MAGYYRLGDLGFRLAEGNHVLKADAFDAIASADALVDAAQKKAHEIIASAEEVYRLEAIRGYEKGLADARIEAVERLLEESGALDRAIADLQHDLSRIVTAAVRKLVDGFDDQAKVEAVLRSALKQMRREKRLQLRVAPSQLAALKASVDAIVADFPEIELVDIVEDAALTAPRIIVESAVGRIDGNIGDRLADLETAIRGAVRRVAEDAAPITREETP